jgi:hypothetical protein
MRRITRRIRSWRKRNPDMAIVATMAIAGVLLVTYKLFINPAPEVPYTAGWPNEGNFNQSEAAQGTLVVLGVACLAALWLVWRVTSARARREQHRPKNKFSGQQPMSPEFGSGRSHTATSRSALHREAFEMHMPPSGRIRDLSRDWPEPPPPRHIR